MSKTKTPFFSLGAQGSLGESITVQRRNSATLVRTKPLPANPRTLPQMYQRWLYEDYAHLWRQQSPVTKADYRSLGTRGHLTAFQYWMKDMLTRLPDIAGYWKLDDNTGASTVDSSNNSNTATIFGASPAIGPIGSCFNFDGLNDNLVVGLSDSLSIVGDFTVEAFIHFTGSDVLNTILSKGGHHIPGYQFYLLNGLISIGLGDNRESYRPGGGDIRNALHHVAFTLDYSTKTTRAFLDGVFLSARVFGVVDLASSASQFRIGSHVAGGAGQWARGLIDQVAVYTRILDDPTILRHSLRRYPL